MNLYWHVYAGMRHTTAQHVKISILNVCINKILMNSVPVLPFVPWHKPRREWWRSSERWDAQASEDKDLHVFWLSLHHTPYNRSLGERLSRQWKQQQNGISHLQSHWNELLPPPRYNIIKLCTRSSYVRAHHHTSIYLHITRCFYLLFFNFHVNTRLIFFFVCALSTFLRAGI